MISGMNSPRTARLSNSSTMDRTVFLEGINGEVLLDGEEEDEERGP